jgi:hypothetical protein
VVLSDDYFDAKKVSGEGIVLAAAYRRGTASKIQTTPSPRPESDATLKKEPNSSTHSLGNEADPARLA